MVHFRHQLKCFSCYDIGVPNQIVTLHMSICVIFVLSYFSTYIYIYIYCFGLIFGGCPLVFLLFLRFTIIVCDKLLYQTISTIYISTKFKMDCGGIISEYSNILCWNRRLIWGIILVCQNHLNIINNDRNLLTSKVFSAFFFLFAHRVYTNAKNLP